MTYDPLAESPRESGELSVDSRAGLSVGADGALERVPDGGSAENTGKSPSPALSAEERRVFEAVPHGRANAIKQRHLADKLGVSTRRLQRTLKDLTELRGLPIASACKEPMGVFVPQTSGEVDEFVANLKARAVSCFRRINALKESEAHALAGEIQGLLPLRPARNHEEACTDRLGAEVTCLACGKKFIARRNMQRFCRTTCRMAWHGRV